MVTEKQAYEWVKTGKWNLKEFTAWVNEFKPAVLDDKYQEGYDNGFANGYDAGYNCAESSFSNFD